jgi:hypothetical protein
MMLTLLLHWCYTVGTLLSLLSHRGYAVVTLLLHYCYTVEVRTRVVHDAVIPGETAPVRTKK